jgi:hexosaminidase
MVGSNPILKITPPIRITHFSGDLFKLAPTNSFASIPPGGSFTFDYQGIEAINKPSWAPAGLYIVFENDKGEEEKPEVIGATTVDPFTRPEQINRGRIDKTPIPTPFFLHQQNQKLTLLPGDCVGKITPTPVVYRETGAAMSLTRAITIRCQNGLEGDAKYLRDILQPVLGVVPYVERGTTQGADVIVLRIGKITVADEVKPAGSEAYTLDVDPSKGITITGADADGAFYGIQTLLQLLPPTSFAGDQRAVALPVVHVEDAPRFMYRGQHMDVSHNFHSKASILQLLRWMAFYKLNKFHFQLSDDEGWRIEIPEIPELTAIGGGRAHTRNHDGVLHPTYGSGPFRDPPTFGTGFYTRQDFIEILKFAHDLHIDVTESNPPTRAAIVAMKAREKRLLAEGITEEARNIACTTRTTREAPRLRITDNAVCVVDESVYRFAETIIRTEEIQRSWRAAGRMAFRGRRSGKASGQHRPVCGILAQHPN